MNDEPIFEHLWHDVTSHLPFHHHAAPAAQPERHTTMDLTEILARFQADAEADKARIETYLTEHLPALASYAQAAATNPLVAAALNIVHLEPGFLSTLASVITEADNKLGAAKQAAADAEAAQQAALAAAAPADPAPAEAEPVPAQ